MKKLLTIAMALCGVACATTAPPPEPAPSAAPPAAAVAPPAKQTEPPVKWWNEAIFYEIFVRSFQDSDADGVGDFRGIISRLDYLNDADPSTTTDLGVTALWLMPMFESPSYHGYDAVDYYAVERDYGTEEDFKALLDACHQRGIKVIVDLMLNHSSSEHPWFIDATTNPDSPYRSWYLFSQTNPGWTQPWGNGPAWHKRGDEYFYGVFWEGMPDLDFTNPQVEAEFVKIGEHWLNLGVDGFRLDAIRHLVEDGSSAPDVAATHEILKRMAATWKAGHPEALLVGEIWAGPEVTSAYYGEGDELDLTYDFHLSGGIVGALSQQRAQPLADALRQDLAWLPVQRMSAPFITNHDMDRIASILGGDVDRLKLAIDALVALPGTPFVYYGEEIGLKNTGVGGDPAKRAPMQWTAQEPGYGFTAAEPWSGALGVGQKYSVAAQEKLDGSLLKHYRAVLQLRQSTASLREGLVAAVSQSPDGAQLILQRYSEAEVAVIVLNFGAEQAAASQVVLNPAALKGAGLGANDTLRLSPIWQGEALQPEDTAVSGHIAVPALAPRSMWVGVVRGQP